MGYITNFIVYVFAMLGLIMLALMVFKTSTSTKLRAGSNGKGLKVTDTLSLGARKTLYIVETDGEKFLIAGDVDRTTLISKLNKTISKNIYDKNIIDTDDDEYHIDNFKSKVNPVPHKLNYMDKTMLKINSSQTSPYESVMKSLAEKIRG